MMTNGFARCGWAGLVGLLLAAPAAAYVELPAGPEAQAVAPANVDELAGALNLWPDTGPAVAAWFAVIVILALILRLRPLFQWRNLDALILAAMSLLIVVRHSQQPVCEGGHTWQWWAYLGLTIGTVYFFLRGIGLLIARGTPRYGENVSGSALAVLLVAGLALGVQQLAQAPLSDASRDGLIGGLCFNETGRFPYGGSPEVATRSPLVYLAHAGAAALLEPTYVPAEQRVAESLRWTTRDAWMAETWWDSGDLAAVHAVNGTLFVLTLLGLYVIGARLGTMYHGALLAALFVVFPGTQAVLARPDVMLTVLLLTWTLAFAVLPGVGGLLAGLTLVFAGLAWPWAWLGLPILLAYMLRRGWHALGVTVGVLGGFALVLVGLYCLVTPAPPAADGALAVAGKTPSWQADLADGDTLVVSQRDPNAPDAARSALTAPLWRLLLRADPVTMDAIEDHVNVDWPNGTSGRGVPMHQVVLTPAAEARLRAVYVGRIALESPSVQAVANTRTVLEATWLAHDPHDGSGVPAWELWSGTAPAEGGLVWVRRGVKIAVGVLVLLATLILFFAQPLTPRRLAAGMLLVTAGALVASATGPVANHAWLLPALLMAWVLPEESAGRARAAQRLQAEPPPPTFTRGPAPRITKDD